MRNAIRQIVQVQDNLPVALRKLNIIALAKRGHQFREELIERVNALIGTCSFLRDPFTGSILIYVPSKIRDNPARVLQHFVAALAQTFKVQRVEKFQFKGLASDKVGKPCVSKFVTLLDRNMRFNVFSVKFERASERFFYSDKYYLKNFAPEVGTIAIAVSPEIPRRGLQSRWIVPLQIENQTSTWKRATIQFPEEWWMAWKIEVYVKNDLDYYIRPLGGKKGKSDLKILGKHCTGAQFRRFKKAVGRAQFYPNPLYAVLCHKEGHREWVDSLPQFGIDLSEDVKTTYDGNFDLNAESEWIQLEWTDEMKKYRNSRIWEEKNVSSKILRPLLGTRETRTKRKFHERNKNY